MVRRVDSSQGRFIAEPIHCRVDSSQGRFIAGLIYFTSSDREAAQLLLMTHFPGCQPIEEHHNSGQVLQEPAQEDWDLALVGYWDGLLMVLVPLKVVGENGIFPSLLQHGIKIIIGHIEKIFAACLVFGYIPLAWMAVRVIFITKPGRDSYELAKSFRPIILTSSYIRAGQYAYHLVQKIEGSLNQK
jgi:hypothetical protein